MAQPAPTPDPWREARLLGVAAVLTALLVGLLIGFLAGFVAGAGA